MLLRSYAVRNTRNPLHRGIHGRVLLLLVIYVAAAPLAL